MKLLNGENKKILQNPSFYFVILLLFVSIIINAFYYSPQNTINYIDFNNSEKTFETDDEFKNYIAQEYNLSIKTLYEDYVKDSKTLINDYANRFNYIDEIKNDIQTLLDDYKNFNTNSNDSTKSTFKTNYENFSKDFFEYSESNLPFYYLINSKTYEKYKNYLNDIKVFLNDSSKSNENIINFLNDKNFEITLVNIIDELYPFTVSSEILNTLSQNIDKYIINFEARNLEIISLISNLNQTDSNTLIFKINEYCNQSITIRQYVKSTILYEGLFPYSEVQINSFLNTQDLNMYEVKENLAKNTYLLENNKTLLNYSVISSISNRSTYKNSIFDFAYLASEVCFIIIIFYMIFLCTYTISGEFSRGTLKLLVIRPYKRYKILLSKISSILFNSILLIAISYISSLPIGNIFIKETLELPVLFVFNAQKVFVTTQTVASLIYLITKFIEIYLIILFYVLLSTMFKKEIYAFLISSFCTCITFVLKRITYKISILNFLPNLNISLYRFFGGSSSLYSESLSAITQPASLSINFYTSLIYIVVLVLFMNLLAFKNFKRIDIK
ncbi:MAG: ABC transporter permease [Clostridia bacterium]|nr:ABC transporter permease [Clostridia bacterium]